VVAVVRFKARYNNNNNNITYVTMRTVFVFFGKFKKNVISTGTGLPGLSRIKGR